MQHNKTKNLWEIYASQKGFLSKNNLKQHSKRNRGGETPEASGGDSVECSRKIKKKEKKMKNNVKKKVLSHLKEDTKEFKEQIKDDKKLQKMLKNKKNK